MTPLNDWIVFLKESQTTAGFPLVVAGLGLMLFGWRMWKVCVMLSYGVIGAAIAAGIAGPCDDQWLYAIAGGVVLGLISYWPVRYALAILGGVLCACIVMFSLSGAGLSGMSLLIAGGVAMIGGTAFAFLNRQYVVIVVTAFQGAILLISGLAAWIMSLPSFYGDVRAMATGSVMVLPFVLLVPTVMSSFYQAAEVHRLQADL